MKQPVFCLKLKAMLLNGVHPVLEKLIYLKDLEGVNNPSHDGSMGRTVYLPSFGYIWLIFVL